MKQLVHSRMRLCRLLPLLCLPLLGGCFSFDHFHTVALGSGRVGLGGNCVPLGARDTLTTEFTCLDAGKDDDCWVGLNLSNSYVIHMTNTEVQIPEGETRALVSDLYGNSLGQVEVSFSDQQGLSAVLKTLEVTRSCS